MNPAVIGVFIPIVAIVFGIGVGALAIWTEHKRKIELMDRLHRERMLALEKGVEPPALPAAMVGQLAAKPQSRYLWPRAMRNGLMLLFGGIVLYFAVDNAGGSEGAMFMLIPAVLGLANLIYAGVIWKQEQAEPPAKVD
jgi:hypothetical protein